MTSKRFLTTTNRSAKKPIKESHIQKSILEYLSRRSIFAWGNKTTGTYDPKKKVFRANTTFKGVPDIICIINGIFVGLEVKTASGKQTEAQRQFERRCSDAGGEYFVVRSIDDVASAIDSIACDKSDAI